MRRTRVALGAILVISALTAFTCNAPPPGPPSIAPVVTSVSATPTPIVPGNTMTVEAVAQHPVGIWRLTVQLIGPAYRSMGSGHSCGQSEVTPLTGTESQVSLQCVVPEATPNGSWQLRAIVWASDGGVTVDESTVSDAGGSNDDVGPELTIVTPMPASVSRGESFTVAMRATDQSPPLRALSLRFFEQAGPFADNDLLECDPPSLTDVSPGVVDVAWVCSVPADLHRGSYWGGYSVVDDFDQGSGEYAFLQIT